MLIFLSWCHRSDGCFLHCSFCPSFSTSLSVVNCHRVFLHLNCSVVGRRCPVISPSLIFIQLLLPSYKTVLLLSSSLLSLLLSFQQWVSENVKYNEECLSCNTHSASILIDQWSLHHCRVSLRTREVGGWVFQHVMYQRMKNNRSTMFKRN